LERKNKKVKVLHVLGSMNMGGIQMFLMNILRNIDNEEVQFDFACMNDKNYFKDEIETLGGNVFFIESHKKIMLHKKLLFQLLNENEYDYIHIHSGNSLCVIDSYLVKKYSKKHKVVYHSHNSSSKSVIMHKLCKPFVTKYNDYYFACSTEAAKWMYSKQVIFSKQYTLISNGIDVKKFLYSKEIEMKVSEALNLKDCFVIGHVGRFNTQKNHRFLIEIFYKITEKKENVKLLLMGTGPLESEIKERVKDLGIEDKVCFLGNRDDVEKILCACDVFVFPSLHEGLPLTLIEAQSSGLSCYISDVISDEVIITPLVQKISLDETAAQWADKICEYVKEDRIKNNEMVKKSKYNLEYTVRYLSDFYYKNL